VIDIGAGPGVFALLACRYGAGTVIAIEPNDSIELLRRMAAENDCSDRITIVQGLSNQYEPDAKADVIISDLRGALPLFENHIPTIVDARDRLLEANGTLIPSRDTIRMAVVDSEESYAPSNRPWLHNHFNVDLSYAHRFAANVWSKVKIEASTLLCDPVTLAVLDYSTITDPDLTSSAKLIATRAGTAHGLLLWFDAELAPGIGFSNAPGEPPQVYGQSFFPFERPVELLVDDRIEVGVRAKWIAGDYVWSWQTDVYRGESESPIASYRQSSFQSRIFSPAKLARRATTFIPPALPDHAVDLYCLGLFDGKKSLGVIADALAAAYPDRFAGQVDALTHVTLLADRYAHTQTASEPATPGAIEEPLP